LTGWWDVMGFLVGMLRRYEELNSKLS
jgi:hypothetical protein